MRIETLADTRRFVERTARITHFTRRGWWRVWIKRSPAGEPLERAIFRGQTRWAVVEQAAAWIRQTFGPEEHHDDAG